MQAIPIITFHEVETIYKLHDLHSLFQVLIITLAANRRRKGMVIILCVCVFAKFWKNYEHWRLKRATGRLEIIQGSKTTTGFW